MNRIASFSPSLILLLLLCLAGSIHCNRVDDDDDFCCNPPDPRIRKADSALTFTSPYAAQIAAGGDFAGVTGIDAVEFPNVVPFAFGFPFPDPTGIQATTCLQQTEAAFAEIGCRGRDHVAMWHNIGGNATAKYAPELASYLSFVSDGAYLPALSWTAYPGNNPEAATSTFVFQTDAKGLNCQAYAKATCRFEFRPINSPSVPSSIYYSHAFLSGRQIHISLLTSDNPKASVYAQTQRILFFIQSILNAENGQGWDTVIGLDIFLANISHKAEMDAAYLNYFAPILGPNRILPPLRMVYGGVAFPLPSQSGATVGIRGLAYKIYRHCPEVVEKFNVREIYHEPLNLSSMGALAGNQLFFAGVFGTPFPGNPSEAHYPSTTAGFRKNYYRALLNSVQVGARKGAGLADFVYVETFYGQAFELFDPQAEALADLYLGTSWIPPANTNEADGVNPDGHLYQLKGMFFLEPDNFGIVVSTYPWANNGPLLDQAFSEATGFPITGLPSSFFCTNSTLVKCAKPGFVYNNYPIQPYNSLGHQDLSGFN